MAMPAINTSIDDSYLADFQLMLLAVVVDWRAAQRSAVANFCILWCSTRYAYRHAIVPNEHCVDVSLLLYVERKASDFSQAHETLEADAVFHETPWPLMSNAGDPTQSPVCACCESPYDGANGA